MPELEAVEPVESIVQIEPQVAVPVLADSVHPAVLQTVPGAERNEAFRRGAETLECQQEYQETSHRPTWSGSRKSGRRV